MQRVLLLSRTFPAHHRRKGEQTDFFLKISNKLIERGLEIALNVGAVGDVPPQRMNFIHALSCGILPTACYRIVLKIAGHKL